MKNKTKWIITGGAAAFVLAPVAAFSVPALSDNPLAGSGYVAHAAGDPRPAAEPTASPSKKPAAPTTTQTPGSAASSPSAQSANTSNTPATAASPISPKSAAHPEVRRLTEDTGLGHFVGRVAEVPRLGRLISRYVLRSRARTPSARRFRSLSRRSMS